MPDLYKEELQKKFTDPELRARVSRIRSSIAMAGDIVAALSASFDELFHMESAAAWAEKMADEIALASDFFQRLELSMLEDKRFLGSWGRGVRWSQEDSVGDAVEPESQEMIRPPVPPKGLSPVSKIADLFKKGD